MKKGFLVYVAIGSKYDPLLLDYSNHAKKSLSNFESVLITDHPARYRDFQGKIIHYSRSNRISKTMKTLVKKRPELTSYSKGYWFLTFERLLALEQLVDLMSEDDFLIHLESDVLTLMTSKFVDHLCENETHWAFAPFANNLASAAFVYVPNLGALVSGLDKLHILASEKEHFQTWSIDMELMRDYMETGDVRILPSEVNLDHEKNILPYQNQFDVEKQRYLFDSGDLGAYLFGRNSVYSKGKVGAGHRYEHIKWPIQESFWILRSDALNQHLILSMQIQEIDFDIPYLHIVSKLNLVKDEYLLLKQLFPLDTSINIISFPQSGIQVQSRHSKLDSFRVRVRLKLRFLIRECLNMIKPKNIG